MYLQMQPFGSNPVQGRIVQNDNAICTAGQPAKRQKGVVWLHNDITKINIRNIISMKKRKKGRFSTIPEMNI